MDITPSFKKLCKQFTCPYCEAQLGYEIQIAQAQWAGEDIAQECIYGNSFTIVECKNCQLLTLFTFNLEGSELPAISTPLELEQYLEENPEIIRHSWDGSDPLLYPIWLISQGQYPATFILSQDVPENIKNDLQEAGNCLAIGASKAALIMSRRVIEGLASYLGVAPDKKTKLHTALDTLLKNGAIDSQQHKFLMEVKEWGNLGAHLKLNQTINLYEAHNVVELAYLLLQIIFPKESLLNTIEVKVNLLQTLRSKK